MVFQFAALIPMIAAAAAQKMKAAQEQQQQKQQSMVPPPQQLPMPSWGPGDRGLGRQQTMMPQQRALGTANSRGSPAMNPELLKYLLALTQSGGSMR